MKSKTNVSPSKSFREQVMELVRSIPAGYVVSYGQIAQAMDKPRAARQVGFALRSLGPENNTVPWWRVINNSGQITIKGYAVDMKPVQQQMLEAEGVEIDHQLKCNISKYRYQLRSGSQSS